MKAINFLLTFSTLLFVTLPSKSHDISVCKIFDGNSKKVGNVKEECRGQTVFIEEPGIVGPKGPKGDPGKDLSNETTTLQTELRSLQKKIHSKKDIDALRTQLLSLNDVINGCPGVTFTLPRPNQKTDYVRYRSYVPAMKEWTVCAWIKAKEDSTRFVSVLSYASSKSTNELLIGFRSGNRLWLEIKKKGKIILKLTRITSKFHLCIRLSSIKGRAAVYINGTQQANLTDTFSSLTGGGDLILGQDQDARNAGSLDAKQAFSGSVTNLMIWPRLLTASEIGKIARSCHCPRDYSIAMTMDKSELHGKAGYHMSSSCLTV